MFVLIETQDVELVSVRLFSDRAAANGEFERAAENEKLIEHDLTLFPYECTGTIRLAGDDARAVQLLDLTPEDFHL